MPMLEVLVSRKKPLTWEEKEALKKEAEDLFQEVIGTPKGRLQVFVFEALGAFLDPDMRSLDRAD